MWLCANLTLLGTGHRALYLTARGTAELSVSYRSMEATPPHVSQGYLHKHLSPLATLPGEGRGAGGCWSHTARFTAAAGDLSCR